jgi:hypothetical protein
MKTTAVVLLAAILTTTAGARADEFPAALRPGAGFKAPDGPVDVNGYVGACVSNAQADAILKKRLECENKNQQLQEIIKAAPMELPGVGVKTIAVIAAITFLMGVGTGVYMVAKVK